MDFINITFQYFIVLHLKILYYANTRNNTTNNQMIQYFYYILLYVYLDVNDGNDNFVQPLHLYNEKPRKIKNLISNIKRIFGKHLNALVTTAGET